MKSWKTTTTGIIAIIVAILGAATSLLDADPATNPDMSSLIASIVAGIGLITARDANVSSEQQGIKK